eukprot:GILJ01008622.1.p1 GENE.GILJ01008622.1~~GILJ01008622.1.p1  ORF type:complete len:1953 (-),score=319.42 GILJ01008622.1:139-5274(-)
MAVDSRPTAPFADSNRRFTYGSQTVKLAEDSNLMSDQEHKEEQTFKVLLSTDKLTLEAIDKEVIKFSEAAKLPHGSTTDQELAMATDVNLIDPFAAFLKLQMWLSYLCESGFSACIPASVVMNPFQSNFFLTMLNSLLVHRCFDSAFHVLFQCVTHLVHLFPSPSASAALNKQHGSLPAHQPRTYRGEIQDTFINLVVNAKLQSTFSGLVGKVTGASSAAANDHVKRICSLVVATVGYNHQQGHEQLHNVIHFWFEQLFLSSPSSWLLDLNYRLIGEAVFYGVDYTQSTSSQKQAMQTLAYLATIYATPSAASPNEGAAGASMLSSTGLTLGGKNGKVPSTWAKETPRLAFAILYLETVAQRALWETAGNTILARPQTKVKHLVSMNMGLKKDMENYFTIFQWANLANHMDPDHPLVPLVWQVFLRLYMSHVSHTHPRGTIPADSVYFGAKFLMSKRHKKLKQSLASVLKDLKDRYTAKQTQRPLETKQSSPAARAPSPTQTDDAANGNQKTPESEIESTRPGFSYRVGRELDKTFASLYTSFLRWFEMQDLSWGMPRMLTDNSPDIARLWALLNDDVPGDILDPQRGLEFIWWDLIQPSALVAAVDKDIRRFTADNKGGASAAVSNKSNHSVPRQSIVANLSVAAPTVKERLQKFSLTKPLTLLSADGPDKKEAEKYFLELLREVAVGAKQFDERLARMVGLDQQLEDLVPHLYRQETVEKRVERPCESIHRSGSQCRSPAQFVFQFPHSVAVDAVVNAISENRTSWRKCHWSNELSDGFLLACLLVERCVITLRYYRDRYKAEFGSNTNRDLIRWMDIGSAWFTTSLEFDRDNVRLFAPSKITVQNAVQGLAVFPGDNADEMPRLLELMLEDKQRVALLHETFHPHMQADKFVQLFENLNQAAMYDRLGDSIRAVLKQFNVPLWLESNPSLYDRRSLFQVSLRAACIAKERSVEAVDIMSIHCAAAQAICLYQFPDMLEFCIENLLTTVALKRLDVTFVGSFLAALPVSQRLGHQQASSLLNQMSLFFWDLRLRGRGGASKAGSLHTLWAPYLPLLLTLIDECMGVIVFEDYLVSTTDPFFSFNILKAALAPFLLPAVSTDPHISSPWQRHETDVQSGQFVVSAFVSQLMRLHAAVGGTVHVLQRSWDLIRGIASMNTESYILRTLTLEMLRLNWSEWCVPIEVFHDMRDVIVTFAAPHPMFDFMQTLILKIDWNQVISRLNTEHIETATFLFALITAELTFADSRPLKDDWAGFMTSVAEERFISFSQLSTPHCLEIIASFVFRVGSNVPSTALTPSQLNISEERYLLLYALLRRLAMGISVNGRPERAGELVDRFAGYIRLVVSPLRELTAATSKSSISEDQYKSLLRQILDDIDAMLTANRQFIVLEQSVALMREMYVLLNAQHNENSVQRVSSELVRESLSVKDPALALERLVTVCRTVLSPAKMASCIDLCIESALKVSVDIMTVSQHLELPVMFESEFIESCVNQGSVLTLQASFLKYLHDPKRRKRQLLDMLLEWVCALQLPVGADSKLVLLIQTFIFLFFSLSPRPPSEVYKTFRTHLLKLSEDKKTEGLVGGMLGMFGLGSKSTFSIPFRLTCRCIATFMAVHKKRFVPDGTKSGSNDKLMRELTGLLTNKDYATYREQIMWAIQTIPSKPEDSPAAYQTAAVAFIDASFTFNWIHQLIIRLFPQHTHWIVLSPSVLPRS